MLYVFALILHIVTYQTHAFGWMMIEDDTALPQEALKPIETPDHALDWKLFANVKVNESCKEEEGIDICSIFPTYTDEVLSLHNQEVILYGYLFPLEASEEQQHFLFGPFPQTCPFHYHVSPNNIIEVKSSNAVKFTYDPLMIKGKLSVEFDEKFGSFYLLTDATIYED